MRNGFWQRKKSGLEWRSALVEFYLDLTASTASAIPAIRKDGQKTMPAATETAVAMRDPAAIALQFMSFSFRVGNWKLIVVYHGSVTFVKFLIPHDIFNNSTNLAV